MNVLTPAEIKRRLSDRNLAEVSRRTEVPYNTVHRYASDVIERPSYDVLTKLSAYLTEGEEVEA